ncbi:MAG: hypothetical protein R3E09_07300 [Novosphingobium sp.]
MMICCIIATMILAQIMATIRRWGVFWGVVRPYEDEAHETVYQRIGSYLRRPRVRAAVFAVAAVEFVALSAWVYVAHGTHFYQLGDQLVGAARGQQIVYAQVCGDDADDITVRIVVDRPRIAAFRAVLVNAT